MTRAEHQSAHDAAIELRDRLRAESRSFHITANEHLAKGQSDIAKRYFNLELEQCRKAEQADFSRLFHARAIQTIDRNARRHANRRNKETTK